MEKVKIIATLMILQGFLFLHVQSWDFQYSCSYDNGNYNVSWMCNSTSDELYFKVQVKATGWVGFGLADNDGAPNSMRGYDVAVGGINDTDGSCYLQDYLTDSHDQMKPSLDLQQDWNILNCSEDSGVTTLIFSRAKNTSDENDTAVQIGVPLCLIWAYHNITDVTNDTNAGFPKHTDRGYDCNKTLVQVPGETTTTTSTASPTATSTTSSSSTTTSTTSASSTTTSTTSASSTTTSTTSTSSTTTPTTTTSSTTTSTTSTSSTTTPTTTTSSTTTPTTTSTSSTTTPTTTSTSSTTTPTTTSTSSTTTPTTTSTSSTTTPTTTSTSSTTTPTTTTSSTTTSITTGSTTTTPTTTTTSSTTTSTTTGSTTTTTTGGATTTTVSPTTTRPEAASSSVVVNKTPGSSVILSLTADLNCTGDNLQLWTSYLLIDIRKVYTDAGLEISILVVLTTTCNSTLKMKLNMSFYSGIPSGKTIQGVFDDAVKNGSIRGLMPNNTQSTFTFNGVKITFKPTAEECKKVCCGAGGPVIVEPQCTPSAKCEGIQLPDKKEEDKHCPGESKATCTVTCEQDDPGDSGIHNSASFAVVILLAIVSFIKTTCY